MKSPNLFEAAAEALKANPGWLDEAVGEKDASVITDEPVPTLRSKRTRGGGPPFVKHGSRVSYIRRDLFAYNQSRRRTSTSDTGEAA